MVRDWLQKEHMTDPMDTLLLTPDEMGLADRAAATSGLSSYCLMERAGQAVAAAALRHFPDALRFVVLCGPGNNGGDGYVAARALHEAGAATVVHAHGDPERLKGDALQARDRCPLSATGFDQCAFRPGDVIIDAVFGAGLARDVPAEVARLIEAATEQRLPVVAVDLPSGLDGLSGCVRGAAFTATRTITFMARKPGHLLMPGRALCGPVDVFDIGIPSRIVRMAAGSLRRNSPALWSLPSLGLHSHKFRRGHLAVLSGPAISTGAARLSAMAGLRAGAGLVTIGAEGQALQSLSAQLTAIMIQKIDTLHDFSEWVADQRLSAFVLGPAFGIGRKARDFVERLAGRPLVLDADGISSFRENPEQLFSLYEPGCEPTLVLTPHEGEFARLFPDLAAEPGLSKVEKAAQAAARARAIVVYKGADTVIASPAGQARINDNAPAFLATAGSGDVLAGIIGGLMAQGMPAFDAASAGVWLHGAAGTVAGQGLTAEDLPAALTEVLAACSSDDAGTTA